MMVRAHTLKMATGLVVFSFVPGLLFFLLDPRIQERSRTSDAEITVVEVATAQSRGIPILWIDVRSLSDYKTDHWEGAVHLSEKDWLSGLDRLMDDWRRSSGGFYTVKGAIARLPSV